MMRKVICLCVMVGVIYATAYSYSECNSSSYLNTADLQCDVCGANQIANRYQTVPVNCQCENGYRVGTNGTCSAAFTASCATNNSYYSIFAEDGSATTGTSNCTVCDGSAYANMYDFRDIVTRRDVLLVVLA